MTGKMDNIQNRYIFLFLLISLSGTRQAKATTFTIINDCKTTIWPAMIPGENFGGGGFALSPGQSVVLPAPDGWSGRIWGRTGCNFDKNGNGTCETGQCGSNLKCTGSGETPSTLAEFTLTKLNFYDVSLVDGFNLPIVVTPVNGKNCSSTGCNSDLRDTCPDELAVKVGGKTVACRSACDVFGTDQYCCKGNFGNSGTCQPTDYSKIFKAACPTAYSYAFDDKSSIFTCSNADYIVTFCSGGTKQTVCTYQVDKLVCGGSARQASLANFSLVALFWVVSLWYML